MDKYLFSLIKTIKTCYTKLSFVKKPGGAFMLLLLLLLPTAIFGQINLSSIQLGCDRITLEIIPKPYTGNPNSVACAECCPGSISCERIEYQVFLSATQGIPIPTSGNFSFDFSDLFISLRLNRISAVVSSINETQTEFCIAPFFNAFTDNYQANAFEDEVTLSLTDLMLEPGQALPDIPFSNYRSIVPLFSVIVDAFPNEVFGMRCAEFTYSSLQDGCAGAFVDATPALFPMPTTTNPALTLGVGNIDCLEEDYIDLPIQVSSTLVGGINLFDFAVNITTTAPDGFYDEPAVVNVLPGTVPEVRSMLDPSGTGRVVNIKYTNQSAAPFYGDDVTICVLRIYRPPNLCQGYTTTATLVPGRIRTDGQTHGTFGCMAINTDKTSAECIVPEVDVCEEFQLLVSTETNLAECAQNLRSYVTLSWDPLDFNGANTLDFEVLKARIDFELEAGVTITAVNTAGFACPATGNNCQGGCISVVGNSIELCILTSTLLVNNNAQIIVDFDAPANCIKDVVVRKINLKLKNSPPTCQPDIKPSIGFPYCRTLAFIQGEVATEAHCWVEYVSIEIKPAVVSDPDCIETFLIGDIQHPGCEKFTSGCLCTNHTEYVVTPTKDDNPLNGVTTYDLVLISKHILGIEPLGSPYKMIAADANFSKSITTFDIVEIRKLILGIYQTFPNNQSWNFVSKSHTFPDIQNPFVANVPYDINVATFPFDKADFVAIKIGDVNDTAVPNSYSNCVACDASQRLSSNFQLSEPRRNLLKAGQYYTLPIKYTGAKPLVAWQTALHFDPEVLELVGPSFGDAQGFSSDNLNLTAAAQGFVRASWFATVDEQEAQALQPGQILFNLTFRVKQDIPESAPLIGTADNVMPSLGWEQAGMAYGLVMNTASSSEDRSDEPAIIPASLVSCRPNPSPGEVTFDIGVYPVCKRAQLTIMDAFGRRVWQRDLSRLAGPLQIAIPEAANWPAGVYHWEMRRDRMREKGTFIRQ